jgi:hypothetical protein
MGYETTTKIWVKSVIPNTNREVFLPFENMDMPENEWNKPWYFIDFFREKITIEKYRECDGLIELEENHCREYLIRLLEARLILTKNGYNHRTSGIRKDQPHFDGIMEKLEELLYIDEMERDYISTYSIFTQCDYFLWLITNMDAFKKDDVEFYVTMEIS